MELILFKLGIIEIDFTAIISFLIGVFLGAAIICLLYALFVLGSLRNKSFIIKTDEDSLTVQDVKEMISKAQESYKDKTLRQDLSRVGHCKNIVSSLVYGIASKFYPKSKLPLLELSIDEALMLTVYVEKRMEEILDRPVLRLVKKFKISSIFSITQKTSKAIDSQAFKIAKETSSTVSKILKVVNAVNPAWWFKKVVMDKTFDIITDKLCVVLIAVVGEETYKIYSKTVFNEEVNIESNVDQILDSIDTDLINASMEIKNNDKNNVVDSRIDEFVNVKLKTKVLSLSCNEEYISIFDNNKKLLLKVDNES